MAGLWCRKFPTVRVARNPEPKPVTMIYPFYENATFFAYQCAGWATYSEALRRHVSAVIVDDGSPTPARLPDVHPFEMRLFRIGVDCRWNWLAARNIGAHHAKDGWLLFTDMDHVVPEATMEAVLYGRHDPKRVYAFTRREHDHSEATPHSASFLMTRAKFWEIGGYDETLSGHYGTDGDFRRRVAEHAHIEILTDVLIRHEYQGDSSTTRYKRKQPEDAAVGKLIAARKPGWKPKTLSFEYQEVAC